MRGSSALLAALLLLAASCAPDGALPRSLILVSLDTVGARHLGCYGHERRTSPNLDAFADGGVLFEKAFATASWTLPSHASLFTGLYPGRSGMLTVEDALDEDVPTLAGVLSERGFATAGVVNGIFLGSGFGFGQGFDSYRFIREDDSAEGAAGKVSDAALAWLEEQGDRRVFLFIHYFDVHSDYRSHPSFERMMGARRTHVDGTTEDLVELLEGRRPLDPEAIEQLERLYDAGIRQLDAELGRLFSRLEAGGWLDSSLVVVTSDHGEEFAEHGGLGHARSHYDELLHVPLILRGPSLPSGVRIPTPVSLVDVAPTAAGLLGVDFPEQADGVDLRTLWEAPDPGPAERWIFSEGGPTLRKDSGRSVRNRRYKLVTDLESGRQELYDWVADPGEQRDLRAERPEIARELRAALEARNELERAAAPAAPLSAETLERLRQLGYR